MDSQNSVERRHQIILVASLNKFSYHRSATPERAIDLLDAFFQAMLPVIDAAQGSVFDLVGHQLLANFEMSGDSAYFNALEAALKMQQLFKDLKPGWEECGFEAEMGIGVHHGEVKFETEERGSYRVELLAGAVVEIACGLAEQGGTTLVSQGVFDEIRTRQDEAFHAEKVWISAVQDGLVAYQLTPQPGSPRDMPSIVGKSQILIAEDHADLREIFATVLRRAGFSVNVARNGHEAMQYLERSLPDLLVLDINMPGPSGLEIIRQVRQRQKPVHIIVITANYQAGRSAEADMADLFLLKPVSITDLVELANRFVKSSD
jgi:CheY-like chemotaxis protein